MCTREDMLAHNLGTSSLDYVMSQNEFTTYVFNIASNQISRTFEVVLEPDIWTAGNTVEAYLKCVYLQIWDIFDVEEVCQGSRVFFPLDTER